MKKYRIREYSPIWWIRATAAIMAWVMFMSIPGTIESLLNL